MYMKQLLGLILLMGIYAMLGCSIPDISNKHQIIKQTKKILKPKFVSTINKDIIPVIRQFEGISSVVYNDLGFKVHVDSKGIYKRPKKGYLTIGVGHRVTSKERKSGTIKLVNKRSISISKPLSKANIDAILLNDLRITEDILNKYVKIGLTQPQFNMLSSLIFNVGLQGFFKKIKGKIDFKQQTMLLIYLNSGEKFKAGLEFMEFINVKGIILRGLVERRQYEMNLFLQDVIKYI